jgi:thioredoxin 1
LLKWDIIIESILGKLNVVNSLSLSLFLLIACGKDKDEKKTESVSKAEAAQKLPKLLDLGAKKCIACKMMAPLLDELTKEYKGVFDVEFIDVWQPENKEKAKAHGIRAIPTQIFFDASGKELWRHEGFFSKEDILKKWKELGFTFKAVPQEKIVPKSAASENE